jgi:hypothetical protein
MSSDDDIIYTCTPRCSFDGRASPDTRGHRRAVTGVEPGPSSQISRMSCMANAIASAKPSVDVSSQDLFDSIPNFIKSGPAKSNTRGKETNTNRSHQRHFASKSHGGRRNHHSQFIPYPSGYAAPKPVPLNWYPALNPLVLNFHVWLRWNSSSENRSAVSPSSGFIRSRRPRRWRSIPFPVAASRVSRVCVCIALFNSSSLRLDCHGNRQEHVMCDIRIYGVSRERWR